MLTVLFVLFALLASYNFFAAYDNHQVSGDVNSYLRSEYRSSLRRATLSQLNNL